MRSTRRSDKQRFEHRLAALGIQASLKCDSVTTDLFGREWLAVTSSHLGHSPQLQREVCAYLRHSMLQARRRSRVVLVAAVSAIEPWAVRAAELFGVDAIVLQVNGEQTAAWQAFPTLSIRSDQTLCRDTVLATLADRVDCLFVRPGGRVESALRQRLRCDSMPTVRVACVNAQATRRRRKQCSESRLMEAGAVGWYCPVASDRRQTTSRGRQATRPGVSLNVVSNAWAKQADEWIIHCTRTPCGPWPGQTEQQYRDAMLLSDRRGQVTPLDALSRILRTRCLFASARTSNQSHPVVCFSSRPLADILKQRCYRPHLHRWDYEPYGIAIRRSAAIDAGLQPVIYGTEQQRKNLPAEDQYRFQSCGKTYDWTGEAEWRCHGDLRLDEFRPNDLRLFVANRDDALKLNTELPISIVGELLEPNARLKALAAWSGITIRS